jgi:probable F420-dependent oxidoreductase
VRIGVTLPQTEIGSDPAVLRDYAQTAESLGYDYINVYDHVLGAQPGDHRPGWSGGYDYRTNFHEPFVMYGYLAAITSRAELVTGILILPQRQTALVAKQAAEVDILSNGRLRLGVAIGWNDAEYEALNENFHERGRKIGEQIDVLRMLWSQEVVTFEGRWHHLNHVAIEPRPTRSIPIWMGGMSETVMKRAARVADGWMPNFRQEGNDPKGTIDRFFAYAREYGRNPDDLGVQTSYTATGTPDDWRSRMEDISTWGATDVSINTMGLGLQNPRDHIKKIEEIRRAIT